MLFQWSVNGGSCLLDDMASRVGLMSLGDTLMQTGTVTIISVSWRKQVENWKKKIEKFNLFMKVDSKPFFDS